MSYSLLYTEQFLLFLVCYVFVSVCVLLWRVFTSDIVVDVASALQTQPLATCACYEQVCVCFFCQHNTAHACVCACGMRCVHIPLSPLSYLPSQATMLGTPFTPECVAHTNVNMQWNTIWLFEKNKWCVHDTKRAKCVVRAEGWVRDGLCECARDKRHPRIQLVRRRRRHRATFACGCSIGVSERVGWC